MSNAQQNINTNSQFIKILIALLTAAATPAIVFFLITSSAVFRNSPETWLKSIGSVTQFATQMGIIIFIIASIHTFIFGAPLFILGLHLKMIRWWTTLISAFIVGYMPYTMIMFAISTNADEIKSTLSYAATISLVLGLFGVSGGLSFWLLWKYWILKGGDLERK